MSQSARRDYLEGLGLPDANRDPVARWHVEPAPESGANALDSIEQIDSCLALIATRNYLAQAAVVARAFIQFHPEFSVVLLLVDGTPADRELFPHGHVVLLDDLELPNAGWYSVKYNAVEFANALKPVLLLHLTKRAHRVVYLDSDVAVFSRFITMLEALEQSDLVLVPHMLAPFPRPEQFWVHPNNADIFNAGLINAGSFAIRPARCRGFLEFWRDANLAPGAFYAALGGQTDQQYFNWALILCERVRILRDTTYNVAYWNLHDRHLRRIIAADGTVSIEVDGHPLTFFHFSGFDPMDPLTLSRHDSRYSVYNLPTVAYLLSWYSEQILVSQLLETIHWPYRFDTLANGFAPTSFVRDLLKKYEPYCPRSDGTDGDEADRLCALLLTPLAATGSVLPLVLAEIYDQRPDLSAAFPGAHIGENLNGLWRWFCRHGAMEFQLDLLVTRFRRTLTSDSLIGFAEEISVTLDADHGPCQFLGADRRAAAGWLHEIGRGDVADSLLEADPEWAFFSDMSAILIVYERREDLRTAFPDIFGALHAAFATWLEEHSIHEHDVPAHAIEVFREKPASLVLARIFSFLSRREDLQRLACDELLSDRPERLLRELMRGSAEGLEFDPDDVEVFAFLHRHERHLLIQLYLELPVVRRQTTSSRMREGQLALLPAAIRDADWVKRGCEIHLSHFDALERLLDDEVRRQQEFATATANHVFDVLRSAHRDGAQESVLPAYRRALQRARRNEQRLQPPRSEAETPVNLFGFFLANTGVGESTRGLANAVGMLRPVTRLPLCTGHLQREVRLEQMFHHYSHFADVNVFVSYPHAHEDFFGVLPACYLRHRRNIIHLAWEQQDWNHHWKSIYDRYDEIWTISEFAAVPFRQMFGANVRVVPNVLNVEDYPSCDEECAARFGNERFTFLFVFDANSSIERKNPRAVIDAFVRAFKGTSVEQSVRLILKVGNLTRNEHAMRIESMMRDAAASGMAIEFDGRSLERPALMQLIASADCFVSLHRAEGFGYTMAEAMYYGVPVIASGYSGNLEYMTHENSLLVPCTERLVDVADGPFQRGSVWGDPDIDAAAELMRRVVSDRAEAQRIGEQGRLSVLGKLTTASVAERLRGCLLRAGRAQTQ